MEKLDIKLTEKEFDFLMDVLGHINYDVEEADIFNSLSNKIRFGTYHIEDIKVKYEK